MDIAAVVRILVVLLLIALTVILITRRFSVPYTLGLVVVGLLIGVLNLLPNIHLESDVVLFVFLPALIFEGSWSISLQRLRQNWLTIFFLVVPGLLLELVLIAVPLYFLTRLGWREALLLSAILSPTDPVAVLSLFKQLKADENIANIIEGESLFNDGVAGSLYQTFLVLVLASAHGQSLPVAQAWLEGLKTFSLQVGGGVVIGFACGFLVSRIVRHIDEPLIETTITIVTAYGVYLLADALGASGIIALIVAALILGSYGRGIGMSETTRQAVDNFWSVIAFLANALLFLLVGTQLNPVHFLSSSSATSFLLVAGLTIVAVLLARVVVVFLLPRKAPPMSGTFLPAQRFVIFWSGLRGALSLALVLALPLNVPTREYLVFSTYAVVFFTLLVQGFSLRLILKRIPSLQKDPCC
jgi:CPA1 family monovalent cation:H+ antiporter